MKYSIQHINSIMGGSFGNFYHDDGIEYLLSDSRKLIFPETTLFFALKGPRRNGSGFVEELYQRGVRNFVINSGDSIPTFPDANFLVVADVLAALQKLSAFHRSQFDIPVIGITGSNGKTIVKEWLNQLLEDRFQIVRSPRSYNSQIGVPLSVWQMNDSHELGIFEAGISHPGEMQNLEEMIRPTIGVCTNVGEAHGENFTDAGFKIEEKIKLFRNAAVVVYPFDDTRIRQALTRQKENRETSNGTVELIGWGTDRKATVRVHQVEKKGETTLIHISHISAELNVSIPFMDDASVNNAITCICILLYLKIPHAEISVRLQRLSAVAMRLELKSGINHCSIINDSYSADISSLKIALDFLEQQQQHTKRTVVLSDILQSERPDELLYNEVAGYLEQKKVNRLVGIGERISAHSQLFLDAGIGDTSFYHSVEAFRENFYQLLFRDETILIKGARVFEFEKIDQLLSEHIHHTVLEINLDAMSHNLRQYQQLLRPTTRLMAMVKAFAYGSGSYEIANLLQFHKVDYLAVAYTDEGVALRKAGIHLPVMVMNVENAGFDSMLQYALEPAIYSFQLFSAFDNFLRKEGITEFPVHLEMETGMNRLGFAENEIEELLVLLKNGSFKVRTVFSHLAASEEPQQDAFTKQQALSFMKTAGRIQDFLAYPVLKHISNSAAIVRHPDLQFDMVRLGIGLYGIDPTPAQQSLLREVSTLKSTIAQVKHLHGGETVGYNRKGVAIGEQTIATIRIGYADGYPRSLGNGNGKVWINGHFAPVTGSVCMDMTMIDITGIPDTQEGDEVIVFGKELPVQQVAHWAGTIPYEILTGISQRVKRIYFEE